MQREFPIRDLGALHYLLCIELQQNDTGTLITQQRYISDLLQRHGMHECKPCATPITPSSKLFKHIGTPLDHGGIYQQIIIAL